MAKIKQSQATLKITLQKKSSKRLDVNKMYQHLEKVAERVIAGGRGKRGWTVQVEGMNNWEPIAGGDGLTYMVELKAECTPSRPRDQQQVDNEKIEIASYVETAAQGRDWTVLELDTGSGVRAASRSVKGYADIELPGDHSEFFAHIFDRESHIKIIISAIQSAIMSDWHDRFHVALIGDPASGKTEIVRSMIEMVGKTAVLEYDATATTQAGAIKDLDERDEIPRILAVEEIEKTEENQLRHLLSILDHRGEIRKQTYTRSIHRDTRMLCICTVNNYEVFKGMLAGALQSRFCYHLRCERPNRDLLQRILEREIKRVGGNRKWIKPVLDFNDKHDIFDPRKLTAICLSGRDMLLDGSYQAMLEETLANLSGGRS